MIGHLQEERPVNQRLRRHEGNTVRFLIAFVVHQLDRKRSPDAREVIANHLGGIAGNYDGLITTGGGSLGQGVIEESLARHSHQRLGQFSPGGAQP